MKKYILTAFAACALFSSCSEDYLTKGPGDEVSTDQMNDLLLQNPEQAYVIFDGALQGNNKYLMEFDTNGAGAHDDFGYMSIKLGLDHMGNDLVMESNQWFVNYYNYTARQVSNTRNQMVWKFYYKVIYNMNDVIKRIEASPIADNDSGKQLVARAKALRANSYFDLVRIYANGEEGIPYYEANGVYDSSRVPTSQIMAYIERDLLESYNYLTPSQSYISDINQNVVAGFLSRFYLTKGDYTKAAQYSNLARQGYALMGRDGLAAGFSDVKDASANSEYMWGADITVATTAVYASFFSMMDNTNDGYAGLLGQIRKIDKRLYDQIPDSDYRKAWFASEDTEINGYEVPKYANLKFRDKTFFYGDYVFMRVAEFYFNEAEALALSGSEAQAKQVLFEIMSTRNPEYTLSTNSGQALLDEIRINKRIEMWGEGLEFFDMKRNNIPLLRNYEGSNHTSLGNPHNYEAGSAKFIFQIPQAEINTNGNITSQNPF